MHRFQLAYDRYYEGRKLIGKIVNELSNAMGYSTSLHFIKQHVNVNELHTKINVLMAFIRQDLRESRRYVMCSVDTWITHYLWYPC